MKRLITIITIAIFAIPAFSQVKEQASIKSIVEDSREDFDLSCHRYQIPAFFVETVDAEALVFLVEDNGYVIPVKLQKNDLNAVNRFLARNLQKGDFLNIEGTVERIEINEGKYRGLVDAVIIDNDGYEDVVEGTAGVRLKGRSLLGSLPKPAYNAQTEGIVVVNIKVDQYGSVTEAIPGAEGTTVYDKILWNAARSAALKTHFNQSIKAPALQTGTITYIFKLK